MPSKKKPEPEPEPMEEDDESSDDDEGLPTVREEVEEVDEPVEPGEDAIKRDKRLKRSRVNERRKARQNGFRSYAELAGAGAGKRSFGNDILSSIFTPSDIKRLAAWTPQADSYSDLTEFQTQLSVRDESLSSGPLKVLGANIESIARKVVQELVMRNVENNAGSTITPANVKSVLRPFIGALHVSDFTCPKGIVRSAQLTKKPAYEFDDEGRRTVVDGEKFYFDKTEEDEATIIEERKFCKANHSKLLKEAEKKLEAVKAERKRKRDEKAATPLAAVAV